MLVDLTKPEVDTLLSMLNAVPAKGIETMEVVLSIVKKLRVPEPKPEKVEGK